MQITTSAGAPFGDGLIITTLLHMNTAVGPMASLSSPIEEVPSGPLNDAPDA